MEDGGGEGNGVVEFRNCGWPHSPVHSANELNYVLNGQLETTTHTHTHTHTYTHTHTRTHVHTRIYIRKESTGSPNNCPAIDSIPMKFL